MGVVDRALFREGLERRVVLRVPFFASALRIVAATDFVVTLPGSLVEGDAARCLHVSVPQLEVPGFLVEASWHRRSDDDPMHAWLREELGRFRRGTTASGRVP